jgi:hypothetical protein
MRKRRDSMDKDAEMLQKMGDALVALQVQYRMSSIDDRAALKPSLQQALNDYAACQVKLLEDGVISTDADLQEMTEIRSEIDRAGDKQSMLLAIARTVAFISTKL